MGDYFHKKSQINKKSFLMIHLIFSSHYCSIDLKRQSEHSGLRPDTSSLVQLQDQQTNSFYVASVWTRKGSNRGPNWKQLAAKRFKREHFVWSFESPIKDALSLIKYSLYVDMVQKGNLLDTFDKFFKLSTIGKLFVGWIKISNGC